MVVATSGTTVFGAYDPLIPISDICKKYGLWLHVDVSGPRYCFFLLVEFTNILVVESDWCSFISSFDFDFGEETWKVKSCLK